LSNLEKQLSDIRQANISTITENKKLDSTSREAISKVAGLNKQVTDLSNQLKAKDLHNANTKQRIIEVEQEIAQLRVKHEQAQKECETWKKKSLGNQSSEEEMLRVGSPLFLTEMLSNIFRRSLYAPYVAKISRTRR